MTHREMPDREPLDGEIEQALEHPDAGSRAFIGSPPPDNPPSLEEVDQAIASARAAAATSPQLGQVARTLQAARDISTQDYDALRAAAITLELETQDGDWPADAHDVALRLIFQIEDVLQKGQGRGIHEPSPAHGVELGVGSQVERTGHAIGESEESADGGDVPDVVVRESRLA